MHVSALLMAAVCGFSFYASVSAPSAGRPNRLDELVRWYWPGFAGFSLRMPIGFGWILHVHHWLYLAVAMAALLVCVELTPVVQCALCFMAGGAAQGIYAYPDWHQVLIKDIKD